MVIITTTESIIDWKLPRKIFRWISSVCYCCGFWLQCVCKQIQMQKKRKIWNFFSNKIQVHFLLLLLLIESNDLLTPVKIFQFQRITKLVNLILFSTTTTKKKIHKQTNKQKKFMQIKFLLISLKLAKLN